MAALQAWTPDVNAAIIDAGPFAGCSIAKAQIVNDALIGHLVEVTGETGRVSRGIFTGVIIPSARRPAYAPWELAIAQGESSDGTWSSWSTRRIGAHALVSLDVIGPQHHWCDHCGRWVLPEQMIDLGPSWGPERRLCCRAMNDAGSCV